MYVCMYVCMYARMYVCTYVYVYVYVYAYVYVYVCVCVCVCVFVCVCMCMCMCMRMYMCMYVYVYVDAAESGSRTPPRGPDVCDAHAAHLHRGRPGRLSEVLPEEHKGGRYGNRYVFESARKSGVKLRQKQ